MVVMINKLKEECLQLSKQNKRLEEQVVYYKNRCNFLKNLINKLRKGFCKKIYQKSFLN
jgi:cell division protein FtsB